MGPLMMFSSADTLSAASICRHWAHWFHYMHSPAPFRGSFVDTMLLAAASPAGRGLGGLHRPPRVRPQIGSALGNPCVIMTNIIHP